MSNSSTLAKRIMIVEDEGIVSLDLRTQLADLGYEVVGVATSGPQAVELADTSAPDLILMDIHLHGSMSGIEASKEIRNRCYIPIIFLTAFVDPGTIEMAKAAEPYGYLVKPFDKRNLQTTIEMALHKADVDRHLREAHDDLSAIMDTQRQGTILLDANRKTVFISPAAKRMLHLDAPLGPSSLESLLGNDSQVASLIEKAITRGGNRKIGLQAHGQQFECEVFDDPRAEDRTILVLTQLSIAGQPKRRAENQTQLIGESEAMQSVRTLIAQFAAVDAPVLIEGETGTGKDLVARAIHLQSARKMKPFLALNCAGLTEELAASQLFGHRRGAFTGAMDEHAGMFEAADTGILFLDEIGELPLRVQTTLLRVLEERAIMRIGETRLRPVDVRIIAATNRKLNEEVEQGRFRADLLYRIRVARIVVPSLRDRIEDLPLLTEIFIRRHAASIGKQIRGMSPSALDLLMTYAWPGNVRELRNGLEYAVIRAEGAQIEAADLPPEITELPIAKKLPGSSVLERDQILQALRNAGGNRKLAAAQLGISRATFYRRIAQLNIGEDG